MTALQKVILELNHLATESKKKYPDIKNECENILLILKIKKDRFDDEEKKAFLKPIFLSCNTYSTKLVMISLLYLHQLTMLKMILNQDLKLILVLIKNCIGLGYEIQLRIFQCLLILMQRYGMYINVELLEIVFCISIEIISITKEKNIQNTGFAALQLLIGNIFQMISNDNDNVNSIEERLINMKINENSKDEGALKLFLDLCYVLENKNPVYFKYFKNLKTDLIIEIVENIVSRYYYVFNNFQNLAVLLKKNLIPLFTRIVLLNKSSFSTILRIVRTFNIFLSLNFFNFDNEIELILNTFNTVLLSTNIDSQFYPIWTKILVLECYKKLFYNNKILFSKYNDLNGNPIVKNSLNNLFLILKNFFDFNLDFLNETFMDQIYYSLISDSTTLNSNLIEKKKKNMDDYKLVFNLNNTLFEALDKNDSIFSFSFFYCFNLFFVVAIEFMENLLMSLNEMLLHNGENDYLSLLKTLSTVIMNFQSNIFEILKKFLCLLMDEESFFHLMNIIERFSYILKLLNSEFFKNDMIFLFSKVIVENNNNFDAKNYFLLLNNNNQIDINNVILTKSNFHRNNIGDVILKKKKKSQLNIDKSRFFSLRKAFFLKVLFQITINLGKFITDDWIEILKIFQWSDYYLYGSNDLSNSFFFLTKTNYTTCKIPKLKENTWNELEDLKKSLVDGMKSYPVDSFYNLIFNTTDLFKILLKSDKKKIIENCKIDSLSNKISVCPYNLSFFLNIIIDFCHNNSTTFLIKNDKIFNHICEFFSCVLDDTINNQNLKKQVLEKFLFLIKNMVFEGFMCNSDEIINLASKKSLTPLMFNLKKIFIHLNKSDLSQLRSDYDLILILFESLYELIDKYGSNYTDSWDYIFKILNFIFTYVNDKISDPTLKEKQILILRSGFRSLKLILNELDLSKSFFENKVLIDTLFFFSKQDFEINISFNSISSFFLINDFFKSKKSLIVLSENIISDFPTNLNHHDELSDLFKKSETKDSNFIWFLHVIYLLSTLIVLTFDKRVQVADAAIQTFFKIIENYVDELFYIHPQNIVHDLMLKKFLNLEFYLKKLNRNENELIKTFTLILHELTFFVSKFMNKFEKFSNNYTIWELLINYYKKILSLEWNSLNLKVFDFFMILLKSFNLNLNSSNSIPFFIKLKNLLFNFWIEIPNYFNDTKINENLLINYFKCFEPLFVVFKNQLNTNDLQNIFQILNKYIKHPIIFNKTKQEINLSKLQYLIIDIYNLIDIKNDQIESQLIIQISVITNYSFRLNDQIKKNLIDDDESQSQKILLFIKLSHLTVKLLMKKITNFFNIEYMIKNSSILIVLNEIIFVIQSISKENMKNDQKILYEQIYEEASLILVYIIQKFVDDNDILLSNRSLDFWNAIILGLHATLMYEFDDDMNLVSLKKKTYEKIFIIIFPIVLKIDQTQVYYKLLDLIYQNSFLYEFNTIEMKLINSKSSIKDKIEFFFEFNFDLIYYDISPLKYFFNIDLRLMCLNHFIDLCHSNTNDVNLQISFDFLVLRSLFFLKNFELRSKILSAFLITNVQEREFEMILQGLIEFKRKHHLNDDLKKKLKHLTKILILINFYSQKANIPHKTIFEFIK